MWSIKVYLILIEAVIVVELASRPCLDLAFTFPYPLLDLVMNLPWSCLRVALILSWTGFEIAMTLPWPCLDLAFTLPLKFSQNCVSNSWDIPDMYKFHQSKYCQEQISFLHCILAIHVNWSKAHLIDISAQRPNRKK